jgi:hypothetical protein
MRRFELRDWGEIGLHGMAFGLGHFRLWRSYSYKWQDEAIGESCASKSHHRRFLEASHETKSTPHAKPLSYSNPALTP